MKINQKPNNFESDNFIKKNEITDVDHTVAKVVGCAIFVLTGSLVIGVIAGCAFISVASLPLCFGIGLGTATLSAALVSVIITLALDVHLNREDQAKSICALGRKYENQAKKTGATSFNQAIQCYDAALDLLPSCEVAVKGLIRCLRKIGSDQLANEVEALYSKTALQRAIHRLK